MRSVRKALAGAWRRTPLEHALSEVLGEEAHLLNTHLGPATSRARAWNAARCLLRSSVGDSRVLLEVEPALAARIAAHVLRRPVPLVNPTAAVPDSIVGVTAALALSVARRIGGTTPLCLETCGPSSLEMLETLRPTAVEIHATLLLGEEAFQLCVLLESADSHVEDHPAFSLESLSTLGDVPLALELVSARVVVDRALFDSMVVGDLFLAGEGWWLTRSEEGLSGKLALCAPQGTRGIPANLFCDGRIVVLEGVMTVDVDEDVQESSTDPSGSFTEVLAEAPVVVRVELGQMSMTAREWAAVRAGDILTTGRRLGERAVLRIAGREVARGELVDVDGELGVRVHEIVAPRNGGAQ